MRPILEILSASPEQTDEIGAALGAILREGDVLALHGGLGAGKTCLVRGIARGIGLDPRQVSSPTFVIVSEYTQRAAGRAGLVPVLIHVDAYRLSGPDDLESVGWERVIDGSSVVIVEWAERVWKPEDGPDGTLGDPAFIAQAWLAPVADRSRVIRIDAPPAWAQRPRWGAILALSRPGSQRCPTCGRLPAKGSTNLPLAPFCSERCRAADLGRWFAGQYTISRDLREDDLDSAGHQPAQE